MYCGMVHLTNDHKPNESTDGYQYFDNVGGGCKNPDCVGGKLSHWAVHHFPSMCAQTISSVCCKNTGHH